MNEDVFLPTIVAHGHCQHGSSGSEQPIRNRRAVARMVDPVGIRAPDRQAEGPFADLDQLQRVRGIGPKTLAGIRPYLRPIPSTKNVAGGGP